MKLFRICAALFLPLLFFACSSRGYVSLQGYAQGGTYCVKYNTEGTTVGYAEAHEVIDSILNDIDFSLSGYNRASILSKLNAGDTVVVNETFCDMYRAAYAAYVNSEGAVDAASAPLFDIWGFGFTTDSMPDPQKVESVLAECGFCRLKNPYEGSWLHPGDTICSSFLLSAPGTAPKLNFNAIAQGYTSDRIADYLHSIGVKDMLVDIGEIYCEGLNPSGEGWTVGVDNPVDGNERPGADLKAVWVSGGRSVGIVTSGNYRKFYVRDGKKYAHTIDPRCGYPVQHSLLSATVVAPTALEADMLATFFMVVGEEQARRIVENSDKLECFLVTSDGTWASEGFTFSK